MSYWYLHVMYSTNKNLDELSQIKYIIVISFIYFFVFFLKKKNGNY